MSKDIAHDKTDDLIDANRKKLTKLYSSVLKDVMSELKDTYSKIGNPAEGATSSELINLWKKSNRLSKLQEQISDIIVDINKESMKEIQDMWIDAWQLNYNYGAYLVETGSGLIGSFELVDKSAVQSMIMDEVSPFTLMALDDVEDKAQVIRTLQNTLTSGITQGEDYNKLADRIQSVVEKNMNQSMTIARTETNRIENASRHNAFKYGEEKLKIPQEKEWISTLDSDTRKDHRKLDGQRKGLDEPFEINGHSAMYPGDFGVAAEDINCRCRMITHIIGFKGKAKRMTYEEWEESHAI